MPYDGCNPSPEIVSIKRQHLERAIAGAVERALAQPMRWGEDDCALWCASVLREALCRDPAARFRRRYTTPRGYLRVLRREGFASLEEAINAAARSNGWRRIDPGDAETGDLGIVEVSQPPGREPGVPRCADVAGGIRPARRGVAVPEVGKRKIQICVLKRGRFWVGRSGNGCGAPAEGFVKTAWKVV